MAKTYTELEAWGIFVGALVIGIVLTSVFWAFITIPDNDSIKNEIRNASSKNLTEPINVEKPNEFINFCKTIDGTPSWDNKGLRECTVSDSSEKNLIVMKFLCKKFNLSLTYGSFGVKCEGKV